MSGATGNTISIPADVVLSSPGRVLQVQQTVYRDTATYTAGPNFAAVPGLDCTITPRSTSNKIMVILSLLYSQNYWQTRIRLLRNSVVVTDAIGLANGVRERVTQNAIWYDGGPTNIYVLYYMGFQYLDSPASTSALTYGIDIGGYNVSYSNYINRNAAFQNSATFDATPVSSMTLMEIAA